MKLIARHSKSEHEDIIISEMPDGCNYSGSVVKTKIKDFYNELIWWISDKEYGEGSGTPPRSIYASSYIGQ